jgi:hypothetical protein
MSGRRGVPRRSTLLVVAAVGLSILAHRPHDPAPAVQVDSGWVEHATVGEIVAASGDVRRAEHARGPGGPLGEASVPAGDVADRHSLVGSGTFTIAPGPGEPFGTGRVRTFTVEVEDGLGADAVVLAEEVERILRDPRSWTASGSVAFQRVDGAASFRVVLASPATVDRACAPLRTYGRFSCWNGHSAMINAWRWARGAPSYEGDLVGYRTYLVNHEVGHALGYGHVGCPRAGDLAPVMMQQTIGVGACVQNPWPYPEADGP